MGKGSTTTAKTKNDGSTITITTTKTNKTKKSSAKTTAASSVTVVAENVSSKLPNRFPPDLLWSSSEKELKLHIRSSSSSSSSSSNRCETLLPGRIWVWHDFFAPVECQRWIDYVEQKRGGGNGKTMLERMQQRATRYMAHRECYRFQMDDPVMAHRIFERILMLVSSLSSSSSTTTTMPNQTLPLHSLFPGHVPVTCNPNLRLYKYTQGMSFGRHVDDSCIVPGHGETRMTVLIYLSSCQGGATRFDDNYGGRISFVPRAGAMLLHVHGNECLLHEALPVESGIKYVLRTDLVYARAA